MQFVQKEVSYPASQSAEYRSKENRVTIAAMRYTLGQIRLQVWWDKDGAGDAEHTDILLEM